MTPLILITVAVWTRAALNRLTHPGERWLAVDGYGFHEGFFHWQRYAEERATPPRLSSFRSPSIAEAPHRRSILKNGSRRPPAPSPFRGG